MKRFDPLRPTAPPSDLILSPQQANAISFVNDGEGNATLDAVAGSGKTTTLIEMCRHINGSAAFAAFNKPIADEIGLRLSKAGASRLIKAATFHSFGFSAWRRVAPRVKVDGKKVKILLQEKGGPVHLFPFITRLVSLAKQNGAGVMQPANFSSFQSLVEHYSLEDYIRMESFDPALMTDEVGRGIEWALKALKMSIAQDDEVIDFDDMIYAPLRTGLNLPQHDWVMIDEAQDTNAVRRELAARMMRADGRLIAVGDRHQAIYGFTGASADALDLITAQFECISLPLTVSYRCSRAVIQHAQNWVPHIEARPDAPEGSVTTMGKWEFHNRVVPNPTDAILCRITKPLIEMAFDFLKRQIPCHVEGRDIGQSLLTLVYKWRTPKTVQALATRLERYLEEEVQRLVETGKEEKIESLQDRVESLIVIMSHLRDDDPVSAIEDLINKIFKDTEGHERDSITLSSVHKAKGREWDTVYLYGRDKFMPSIYAKQLWQIEQEHNLIYVAVTRARHHLIEVQVA